MKQADTVSILVPRKAEYVSVVRLTASGIASRMGFDIDDIEDIKVSISEVLNRLLEKGVSSDNIRIDFHLSGNTVKIDFIMPDSSIQGIYGDEEEDFAFGIIRSLMDEVNLNADEHVVVSMTKKLERAV